MKEKNSIIVITILILAIVSLTGYGIIQSTKKISDKKETKKEYTIEELEQMSKDYYNLIVEKVENIKVATEKNEDGTVTIQLYVEAGDHNSNLDWYTIDPKTATGKNMQNKKIDLKME